MTARTRQQAGAPDVGLAGRRQDTPTPRVGVSELPIRLVAALALGIAGAALCVVGPALGLVGESTGAAFSALPLLTVLAAVAPLLAIGAALTGRAVFAAGTLAGVAFIAPARAIGDLQFAIDPLLAARPEILVPQSLAPLTAGAGLWILLGGHALTALAGLLAVGEAGAAPDSRYAEAYHDRTDSDERSLTVRRRLLWSAIALGIAAAVGLLAPPLHSHDAFVPAADAFTSPAAVALGAVAAAITVLGVIAYAAGAGNRATRAGVLAGMTIAVAAMTLPPIVSGLAVDRLGPAFGPYLALGAVALSLPAMALLSRERDGAEEPSRRQYRLDPRHLHLTAGVFGALAGVAALIGATGEQLAISAGVLQPVAVANHLLIPAGILLLVTGIALAVPAFAAAARPTFAIAVAAIALPAAAALDTVVSAARGWDDLVQGLPSRVLDQYVLFGESSVRAATAGSVRPGAGFWFAVAAVVLAIVAVACAAVAGGAEREDRDDDQDQDSKGDGERRGNLGAAAPLAIAALVAFGAFGLPAVRAPGLVPPGIWTNFRFSSVGLLIALLAVLGAIAVAYYARPARGAALLLGAACVVGVRLLEFPFSTAERAAVGPGTWLAMTCLVALVVGAFMVGTRRAKS